MEARALHLRHARGQFTAMASTYFLGVFNDNFFKQAVLMLGVAAGATAIQGYALVAFTLPFVVLAAPAGWLADRFPKCSVVIGAKTTELLAMLCGAAGICSGHWPLIFVMLVIMGTQAAVFSPALNGSIPELYPPDYVTRANGILRLVVTAAILAGVALAGVALDRPGVGWLGVERGRWAVAVTVVGVAVGGLVVSFGVPHRPAADPGARFPWSGPLHTIRQLIGLRADPLLALTVCANVFVWFSGSLELLLINPLGLQQFGLSKTLTSGLLAGQLVGVALGGLVASRLLGGLRWCRTVAPLGALMALAMIGMTGVPALPPGLRVPALYAATLLMGALGGALLIPMESFLQIRPAPERKGTVLAAVNFVVFSGILLSGLVSNVLNARWVPTQAFGILGGASLAISLGLGLAYRREERRAC